MNSEIIPVILSGGSGSRLWPLSRQHFPKQFLCLSESRTLIQETLHRIESLNSKENIIICNEEHRFLVAEQLRENDYLNKTSIILEPIARNTAPAIALAAFSAISKGTDPLMLVLAADHVITDPENFIIAIKKATPFALKDKVITFGIQPKKAETGYGYIQKGDCLTSDVFTVAKFVEKPDSLTAEEYLASGNYFWNSGIFLVKASVYLSQLQKFAPKIFESCRESVAQSSHDMIFVRPDEQCFSRCESISIDYAIMEHTSDGVMVITDMDWSDVGSWSSLWDISPKSESGNFSTGDVIHHSTTNSYIHNSNGLVATVGIDNLVIVNTKDALLVANKDHVQDVKKIYEHLQSSGRSEYLSHTAIYRSWGHYERIDKGTGFEVRKIFVKPKAKIDLQKHYHRAEHWIVVKGTAEVTKNGETFLLTENESTYISIGELHSMRNPGSYPLEIIEIHTGSYLNEDDNYSA